MAERRVPWGRIVAEGFVIVGSILLAFALDAWWDEQSRMDDLREQARVVAIEMEAAGDALQTSLDVHEVYADLAAYLARALRSVPEGSVVVVSDTVVAPLLPQSTADVTTGSVEAFIEAGGLELVEDPGVRLALLGWSARVEDLQDDEIYLRNFAAADLIAHLRENYAVANADLLSVPYLFGRFGDGPPLDADAVGTIALRHDQQLLNLLAARESGERALLLGGLPDMVEEARRIAGALERR